MSKKIGFLHTSRVHIKTFEDLLKKEDADAEAVHLVAAGLLEHHQKYGTDQELKDLIDIEVNKLAKQADIILCTCSSIAQIAVDLAPKYALPILRIDKPMAEKAVLMADNIIVLASLETTLESSVKIIKQAAQENNKNPKVVAHVCQGAWSYFEADDYKNYFKTIANCIDNLANQADVIVLAQASMADAKNYVKANIPILSSPELALRAVLNY